MCHTTHHLVRGLWTEAKEQCDLLASRPTDSKNAAYVAQRLDPINKVLDRHGALAEQLEAACAEIERMHHSALGFIPSSADRDALARIHDAAPPSHVGDGIQRLCRRILAATCPARSAECGIRKMCTNKCGELERLRDEGAP